MIINDIAEYLKKQEEQPHEKKSFWATDAEKPAFDLYHSFKGTPVSNPPTIEKLMMFKIAKECETSYIKMLAEIGKLKPDNNSWRLTDGAVVQKEQQTRIEMKYKDIDISGYIDGVLLDEGKEIPIEVKSYYGPQQEKELSKNIVKTSYLKQLAIYMDFLKANTGILFYIHRGTGKTHQFYLQHEGNRIYRCLSQTFDLNDTYEHWQNVWERFITQNIEPQIEYRYKYPVEEVDWKKVHKLTLKKVLLGQKVLGDWQPMYSPYFKLYLDRQGTARGYTEDEMTYICSQLNKLYG